CLFLLLLARRPRSPLFPYTTLFRSRAETMFAFAANPVLAVHEVRLAVKNDVHEIVGLAPEKVLDCFPCDKKRHLRIVLAVPIDEIIILVKQYGVSAKYDAAI